MHSVCGGYLYCKLFKIRLWLWMALAGFGRVTLNANSSRPRFRNTFPGFCWRTLLPDTSGRHFCEILLWDTRDTLPRHSCGTLLNSLSRCPWKSSCTTLMGGHSWRTLEEILLQNTSGDLARGLVGDSSRRGTLLQDIFTKRSCSAKFNTVTHAFQGKSNLNMHRQNLRTRR